MRRDLRRLEEDRAALEESVLAEQERNRELEQELAALQVIGCWEASAAGCVCVAHHAPALSQEMPPGHTDPSGDAAFWRNECEQLGRQIEELRERLEPGNDPLAPAAAAAAAAPNAQEVCRWSRHCCTRLTDGCGGRQDPEALHESVEQLLNEMGNLEQLLSREREVWP